MRFAVLLVCALLCVPGGARAVAVNEAHPRVWITGATLPGIVARSGTQNAGMKAELRKFLVSYSTSNATRAWLCGAYEKLTGDEAFGIADRVRQDWLPEMLNRNTNSSTGDDIGAPYGLGEGGAFGRASEMALLFDWYYEELTAVQRVAYARHLARAATEVAVCADTHCEPWRYTNTRLIFLLAAAGETDDPALEAVIQAAIDRDVAFMESAVCDCRNLVSENGEDVQYRFVRMANFIACYAALKSGTDYEGPLDECAYLRNGWRFLFHSMRPDLMVSPKAAWYVSLDRTPDKWNTSEFSALGLASWFGCASPEPNAYARNLAKTLRDAGRDFGAQTEAGPTITGLIWCDTTDPGTDWTTAPTELWNDQRGWYFGRQGWELSTGATSKVRVAFWGGPGNFNGTGTAGTVGVWNGSDNIIMPASGWRDTDFALHYYHWDNECWSRSCATIYNPTADADGVRFSASTGCTGCESGMGTIAWRNMGAQEEGEKDPNTSPWPECVANSLESGGAQLVPAHRGRVIRHLSADVAQYTVTTNELGQDPAKQAAIARGSAWVKLDDAQGQGFGIVWDQAILKSGDLHFVARFNVVNRPSVDGDLATLEGGPLGGVYRSTNTTRIWFDEGDSRGCIYPLEASDEEGNPGKVFLVGGPNAAGRNWAQSWAPCITETYVPEAAGGESFEFYVDQDFEDGTNGRNHTPGTYPNRSCGVVNCGDGTTIPRCKTEAGYSGDPTNRNERPWPHGKGSAACDWGIVAGLYNATIAGETDEAHLVNAWWTGPQVTPPTVWAERDADQLAFGYKANGAAAARVLVLPAPLDGSDFSACEYGNPLFGSGESGSHVHTLFGARPDAHFAFYGDGAFLGYEFSDADGVLALSIPSTVEEVTIGGAGAPSAPSECVLAVPHGYHPREKRLLTASGGTLLALYFDQGGYGFPVWAQMSRDDGATWRDLDGATASSTEIIPDAEVFGAGYVTPRADQGFSAAIEPGTNHLWIATPVQRLNGAHSAVGSFVRVRKFAWTGSTWSTSSSATHDGTEGAAANMPADVVALASTARQVFVAWRGPSGANYSVQSMRIKSGAATAMSEGAPLADNRQYPQLLEYPEGTLWLLSAVRVAGVSADSVRVRTAADGGAAQWGTTSRVPLSLTGVNGEWCAAVGPTGPAFVAKDSFVGYYRFGRWNGSGWTVGDVPEGQAETTPCLVRAGEARLCLTSAYSSGGNGRVERTYWSVSEGWSTWSDVWPVSGGIEEDVENPHLLALRPTALLILGLVSNLSGEGICGLDSQRFDLPPPPASGTTGRRRRLLLSGRF